MFSRRILFCRVVRFNPSRSAAPFLPAMRPDAAFKPIITVIPLVERPFAKQNTRPLRELHQHAEAGTTGGPAVPHP